MHVRSRRVIPFAIAAMSLAVSGAYAAGFTAEQATAGKTAYDSNCAQCHGFKLEGPEAPGLVGMDVMQNWDSAAGLYDFISVAMPPSAPGMLGEDAYLNIVSYIMSFNGAQPGETPMSADPDLLASISLPAETSAGAAAAAAAAPAVTATDAAAAGGLNPTPPVNQAFTFGKQLPGGAAPAAASAAPAAPGVPQAFTFGKQLPTAAN
ncbi:c-type cytochrome [Devosia limi]|uniref:Cytochrome C oxidase, cbb3-type, subunit III n=1 Tax=Devosia limi DSM 17137 TaxID=1121477 RepID=A0A1M4U3F0_9HYPH|nr:c-type cytochrome [Devosia limi]SHE51195.1 Cytochrome C oxidase, cbb3-type, subunit III [Devosia limi DSM 17137]